MAKWENSYHSFDADDGGGGGVTTVNTTSIYSDGLSSTESYLIDDDGNAYNYNNTDTAVYEDYNSSESDIATSDDYDYWADDDLMPNDYSSWQDDNTASDDYSYWDDGNTTSNDYDYWDDDDLMPNNYSSWQDDNTASDDYSYWDDGNTTSNDYDYWADDDLMPNDYSSWQDDNTAANTHHNPSEPDSTPSNNYDYSEADNLMPNDYSSWQNDNTAANTHNPSEPDNTATEESLSITNNVNDEFTQANLSENGIQMPAKNPQEETNVIAENYSTETASSEESLAVSNSSTITQVTEPVAVLSNVDAETVNENPMELPENAPIGQETLAEETLIPADATETNLVLPSNTEPDPINSVLNESANNIDTQQVMDDKPIESVNTAEEGLNSETNDSAALVQVNTGTSGNTAKILDTPQVIDDKPIDPVNKKEELISTENNNLSTNNSATLVQGTGNASGNIAHIIDTPQVTENPTTKTETGIEKNSTTSLNPNTENNKEQINCKSESLKNETAGKTNNIGPKPVLPSERARMALFNKRNSSEDDFYNNVTGGTKKDILDKYNEKNSSSLVVASDIKGQDVTFDDFNIDGMNISINREHDGYGNKFDSVRTIETVKLANGQVVKCNIQDMVGANAESKVFADKHKGMTLPDGKYHFTADKLEKQADGTYNSACFQNTLRLQTKDSNIPKSIRDDINSKYFLFHATEYKEGFIPENGGNRIWINPWSAGCVSSITGGQSTHDDFMNMLTGITPENISVTITSKRHVDI